MGELISLRMSRRRAGLGGRGKRLARTSSVVDGGGGVEFVERERVMDVEAFNSDVDVEVRVLSSSDIL